MHCMLPVLGDDYLTFRLSILQQINKLGVSQFCCDENVDDALELMNKCVVPCLTVLSSSKPDQDAIETIRNEWCKILGDDWPGKSIFCIKLLHLRSKVVCPLLGDKIF